MGREGRGGEEIRKCNDSKSVLIKYTSGADADPPLYVCVKERDRTICHSIAPEEGIFIGLPDEMVPANHRAEQGSLAGSNGSDVCAELSAVCGVEMERVCTCSEAGTYGSQSWRYSFISSAVFSSPASTPACTFLISSSPSMTSWIGWWGREGSGYTKPL